MEPLLGMLIDTNNISPSFGPAAFIMDVPGTNPSIDRVCAHHIHGRTSMGDNLAMTMLKCSKVQLCDYEVKVKMEEG